MNSKPSYGVIVGRFQVHELHDGHLELFRQVRNRHQRVIVLLGCAPTGLTKRNPLDFDVRRRMIQAKFPEFTVVPVQDKKTDELWSKEVDARIRDIVTYGDVQLYGGRDSFIPYYHGEHRPKELDIQVPDLSGEKVRAILTNTVMESADFRAGIIYALQNMFNRVIPTVDIAICYNGALENIPVPVGRLVDHVYVCLGKKPGEEYWRFIGGHADNIAFGMGGALLQQLNRDTCKFAFKCSHIDGEGFDREVFKQPKTDAGKNSKAGKLALVKDANGTLRTIKFSGPEYNAWPNDELITVFKNGEVLVKHTFDQIRERAK